jgi:hypothetical protein
MALAIIRATGHALGRKSGAIPTVGVLVTHAPLSDPVWVALREGFPNLGYVDRILKGVKPAELPIEQLSELKLAVNLRAAKAINIVIPESILVRADKVIR